MLNLLDYIYKLSKRAVMKEGDTVRVVKDHRHFTKNRDYKVLRIKCLYKKVKVLLYSDQVTPYWLRQDWLKVVK